MKRGAGATQQHKDNKAYAERAEMQLARGSCAGVFLMTPFTAHVSYWCIIAVLPDIACYTFDAALDLAYNAHKSRAETSVG